MQPVRRRGKRNKSNPNLVKEKAALERVLGAPHVVALEARLPQEKVEAPQRGSGAVGRTAVEQLRDHLDTLSGTRRPCPLDLSKCLHQVQVDQDTLYFPFEPLAAQRAVCNHVIKACDRGGIALLQSPTGTGKSLALLCATLAWQRRVAGAAGSSMEVNSATVPGVPQIVYGVRTHTQIKQMVGELRKSGYRPRMAVIGSREQLCANDAVQRRAKQQHVPLNFSCRQAARCAAAQLPGGCQLYTGMGNSRYAKRIFDQCGQAGRLWDVEDLTACASPSSPDSIAGCPYYTAHILAVDADIVFCPHNYILDPSVSQCRSHHRERWSLKNRIVIIDEAHNLEQCCREAGSLELSNQDLRSMSRSLRQMPLRHPKLRFSERRSCAQVAAELERLPLQLSAFLSTQRISREPTSGPTSKPPTMPLGSHLLWGLPTTPTTKVFLQQCGLTPAGLLSKSMEDLSIEAIDKILQAQLSSEQQRAAESEDAELLTALEKLRDLIFKLRLTCKHSDSYVVAIHPEAESRLCLWLMSPGVLFEVFAHAAHAVLLASGTLSPGALQTELMESSAMLSRALVEGPLEARHTVNTWQLFAGVLPCGGKSAAPMVSTYGNWQSEEFVQNLGLSVLEVVRCVPAGVLCFLPSYQSLDLAVLFWRRSGLWRNLEEVKTLVVEPRSSCEMSEASQRFMTGVKDGRGALCLAVYRGKMSEGLDFSDDLCRAVICIGVPYPQMNDPVVVAKRQWNDAKRSEVGRRVAPSSNGRLSGDEWYELQAHRAVNQALGRLLRHGSDYGALLLLDARWARRGAKARNLREKLSGWIQKHLVDWPCSNTGLHNFSQRLRQHFEHARQRPAAQRITMPNGDGSPSAPLPVSVPTPLRCEAAALPVKRPFLEVLTARSCPKMA